MNPYIVYFPFTHVTKQAQKALHTFFDSFYFIRPDARADSPSDGDLKGAGRQTALALYCEPEVQAQADALFMQYLEWVNIHKGNERNLKLLFQDSPYFRNDLQVSAIKTQIKKDRRQKSADQGGQTGIERDLLFLKTTQRCDRLNEDIDDELDGLEVSRKMLFSELRGLENDGFENEGLEEWDYRAQQDPGEAMTGQRIASFAACMSQAGDSLKDRPRLFVTTSCAVFEYLESNCESCVNALDINEIKVHENGCDNIKQWQDRLMDSIAHAVQHGSHPDVRSLNADDRCTRRGLIRVKIFSDNEINRHFNPSENQTAVCLIGLK